MRQPFYDMGQRAVELLISMVEARHNGSNEMNTFQYSNPQRVEVPTELIVRESSGIRLPTT